MTTKKTTTKKKTTASEDKLVKHIRGEFVINLLPENMWPGVELYLLHGICTGDFLIAILENSLARAAAHADIYNRELLFEWAAFLFNGMPIGSWGSIEQVKQWKEIGGMLGQAEARKKKKPEAVES